MKHSIHILAICCVVGLSACATHVHTLVPETAGVGRVQHGGKGIGKIELNYAGKQYSGEFQTDSARRIHGEHQRHPGSVAQAVLLAPEGAKLNCHLHWANATKPSGECKDEKGVSFNVRFE